MEKRNNWFTPVAHFAAHILVGSIIFVLIALPAFGLGLLVQWLERQGTAQYVLVTLTLLEYAIVTVDAVGLLAHLVLNTYRAFKETLHEHH